MTVILSISDKGQITLPKKIREVLSSNAVRVDIDQQNGIYLTSINKVAGSLSRYKKQESISFDEIRNKSWNDSIGSKYLENEE